MEKLLYTRKEAASLLSISVDTLDDLRRTERIRSVNINGKVLIPAVQIELFMTTILRRGAVTTW